MKRFQVSTSPTLYYFIYPKWVGDIKGPQNLQVEDIY